MAKTWWFRYDKGMRTLSASHSLLTGTAALLVSLLSGCILRPGTVVSRFSGEFVCPEKQIKVDKVGDDRFRATGCNRRANYRCSGEYGEFCERVGQPETVHATLPEAPQQRESELAQPPQG